MLDERIRRRGLRRRRPLEAEALKRPAEDIRQPHKLLGVDVLAGDDLRLKRLDLDRERRSMAHKDFRRLAELILAAQIVGESDSDVAIATCDQAAPVDAAQS